jgi:hypothetical protein
LFVYLIAIKVNGAMTIGRMEDASQIWKVDLDVEGFLATAVGSDLVQKKRRELVDILNTVTYPYAALASTATQGAVFAPRVYALSHCFARSAGGERLMVGTVTRLKLAIYPM